MRIHRSKRATVLIVLGLFLTRCDSLESPVSEDNRFVVESYHEVGQTLGNVRVTRAADLDGNYSADDQGISGANVRIFLLAADGSREQEFQFRELPDRQGVYATSSSALVLEKRSYELEITHPDASETISGTTITPGLFEIVRPGLLEVVYQQDPQFELGVTRSEFPDRQTIMIFSVEALDATIENLTPLYYEFVDPESDSNAGLTEEEILRDVLINESNLVNEGNYEVLPDETINITLPWLGVAFYGPQSIKVSAVDDNIYDFIRSQDVQQGGSSLSPGEIPNVISRLEGATGLFGAYSRVEQETNVARN